MNFFTEFNSVQKILKTHHQVVVYSESRYYYQYFESLLEDLLNHSSLEILYITSDKQDPLLKGSRAGMKVVYIKQFLGLLFPKLRANVMIMTMTDLNNFLYKRSVDVKKYVYIFHAAVSTHLQYREKAFFHYDAIFCTGAYHQTEIRIAEEKYGLPVKDLIPYGYPLLDSIKKKYSELENRTTGEQQRILIAPSWFEYCIFETCIEALVEKLSNLNHKTYIRSHPEYMKRLPKKYNGLKKMVSSLPNVYFDESANVIDSLVQADILITDRSGIALEYAFGTGRPVLFVDTPLKISNPNWENLLVEPIENSIRSKIGLSISPNEVSAIAGKLEELERLKVQFRRIFDQEERQIFFNSTQAYKQGLNYILENAVIH